MKLVKEHINEGVKHLTGRSEEKVMEEFFADGKILFDEFVPFVQKIEHQLHEAGVNLYIREDEEEIVFNEELKNKFIEKIKETFNLAIEYCY